MGRAWLPGPSGLCHRRGAADEDQLSDLPKGMCAACPIWRTRLPAQERSAQKGIGFYPRVLPQNSTQWPGQKFSLEFRVH